MKGCALIDSGVSLGLAPDIALNHLMDESPEVINAESLDMHPKATGIMVGDGKVIRPKSCVALNACEHTALPKGSQYKINVLTEPEGNRSPIIIGMDFLRQHRVVVDFDLGKMWYKDQPTVVYTLKRAQNGLLYFPLSRSEAEKYLIVEHLDNDDHLTATATTVDDSR